MRIDSPEITGELTLDAGATSNLTGSFSGSIDGNTIINAHSITAISASFVNQTYESSSTIVTSGSNIFGDTAADIQQFTGSILQTGSAVISGSLDVAVGTISGSFEGDGSNLTGISSYAVANSSDNRVITSVDSSNGNAEANFTFNGTTAYINGALGVGTSTPTTTGLIRATNDVVAYYSSDERLKDNITPIEDALNKVETLGGYEFDWNNNQDVYEGHDIGVIAQEVEKVLPEIVETRDNGYKAVKYEKLTAVLIQAVKELSERVKTLENK